MPRVEVRQANSIRQVIENIWDRVHPHSVLFFSGDCDFILSAYGEGNNPRPANNTS